MSNAGLERVIGYREATRDEPRSIAYEERMVELAEERVLEQTRRGWLPGINAASGLLAGARSRLRAAVERELWTDWDWK